MPGSLRTPPQELSETAVVASPPNVVRLSTAIILALIAFLVGSLLRSLLSPADFIYVGADDGSAGNGIESGWREVRRLMEIKYIFGGWDFQVAVVRRH